MRNVAAPALALLISLAGAVRIAATYPVFSQAWDEPAHIACGLEWWTSSTATCDPVHPPLARLVIAAPLYFKGLRPAAAGNEMVQGNRILHAGGEYRRNLTLARAGALVFYFISCLAVYRLGVRVFGRAAAVVALALYTSLPMVLHVASLAYTDMALVAFFALFVERWLAWLAARTLSNAVWLGIAAGAAIGSKYSAIPYIALLLLASWGVLFLARKPLGGGRWLLAGALSCLMTLWAIFHFAVSPLSPLVGRHPGIDGLVSPGTPLSAMAYRLVETPIPLSNLVAGIAALLDFAGRFKTVGEPYYYLGVVRTSSVWHYFPMVLLCLFPVAFLIALIGAMAVTAWNTERWVVSAAGLCVLPVNMLGNLSYAPRHLAPLCPFLAILAGAFVIALWKWSPAARVAAALWLAACMIASIEAHPDYHAYSNVVQRLLPPVSLADTGKDVWRLSRALKERHIARLSVAIEGSNDLSRMDLPPFEPLVPYRHTTGWIAISEHKLKIHDPRSPPYDGNAWLESYPPAARIGTSIRLYYIRPEPSHQR